MGWSAATPQPTVLASPQATATVNPNQVGSVTGAVQLKKLSGGKAWDAAKASPLLDNEKVVTGPDSSSSLILGDGSRITVGANSDFRFNQLPSSAAPAQYRLFKGQADIQTQNLLTLQAGKNTFETKASKFSLSYDSGIKKSDLTVASGSVTVSNAAQTQVFSAGQELVISGSKFKPVKTVAAAALTNATPGATEIPTKVVAMAVATPVPTEVPTKVVAQAVVAPAAPASETIAPNHGRVMTVIGDVQIVDDLTKNAQPAKVGDDVTEQETIKTDVSSTVVLKFFDGSQLNISASTQLQLASLKQLQGNDKVLHFKLLLGDLIAKVTKLASSNSSFEIEGGGVVCGVRGTEFHPHYDPSHHLFTVDVLDGTVWVLSDGKTSVFHAGESGRFMDDQWTGIPGGSNTLPGLHDLTDGFQGGNKSNGDNGIKAVQQTLGIHIIVP